MSHDDISRLMVYARAIEESKLRRMARNLKRGSSCDQEKSSVNKKAQTQDDPRSAKVKFRKEVVLKMKSLYVSLVGRDSMESV